MCGCGVIGILCTLILISSKIGLNFFKYPLERLDICYPMDVGLGNSIPITETMGLGLNSHKVFGSGLGMDIACPSLIHLIAIFNSDPL